MEGAGVCASVAPARSESAIAAIEIVRFMVVSPDVALYLLI
jgi:hypothetical protein